MSYDELKNRYLRVREKVAGILNNLDSLWDKYLHSSIYKRSAYADTLLDYIVEIEKKLGVDGGEKDNN